MKKIIYFGFSFLSLFLLFACGKEESKPSQTTQSQPQQQTTVKQVAVGAEKSNCLIIKVKKSILNFGLLGVDHVRKVCQN